MTAVIQQSDKFLSRKVTVNLEHHEINVRSIIKGAVNEASYTMVESFLSIKSLKNSNFDQLFLMDLFKNMINTASIQSRDFAIQVEGCKGVLVWSDERSQPLFTSWSQQSLNISKYAKIFGNWTMKPFMKTGDKLRRKLMSNYPHHLVIGFIGVLYKEQKKGLGTALLNYVIEKANSSNHPIYVEAFDTQSAIFFEKFGFVAQGQYNYAKDQVLIPMIRFPLHTEIKPLRLSPGRRDTNDSI